MAAMATTEEPAFQITVAELQRHNTKGDCWVAVHSKVWDVTEFLDEHPGGPASKFLFSEASRLHTYGTSLVILQCAGTNATSAFEEVHAPGILEENLSAEKFKGFLEEPSSDVPPQGTAREAQGAREKNDTASADIITGPPALHTLISAGDFEKVAGRELAPKTWAFYSSAATDLITHHQNKSLLRRVMIQPRILRDVKNVDMKRNILGFESSTPFFISPAAMAKLAHPDGEIALAKAAASEGIIQCVGDN